MKLCPRCAEPYTDDAAFCPLDGTALSRSSDPFIGRTLAARYRLVQRIGEGRTAVVYLARHVMIERLSAIKILRHDLGMEASHRARFLREARAVNRINHPNIVEITDFGEDGGLVFLVMEYFESEPLQVALARGRFETERATRFALQIASALGRAHELGVIHRDLKPENILLGLKEGPGGVKLTDFGIAKVVDAPTITIADQRFGTAGYIAPECIEGQPATALGDLYSFGVAFYQMLTGARPFDSEIPVELLVMALERAPTPLRTHVPTLPAELEELVLRMMSRKPEERPRSAFAVHDALEAILRRLEHASSAAAQAIARDERAEGTVSSKPTEGSPASSPSPPSWLASELLARPVVEGTERWQKTLADLEGHIAGASRSRGEDAGVRRARELAQNAHRLLASLDRARIAVTEHQAQVDALDVKGKAFRATLGHAIDALSRDRSRELAHLEAIAALKSGVHEEMAQNGGGDATRRETLVWEIAAVRAEETQARALEADLGYQIDTLERQLHQKNEQLEAELVEAAGRLEGGLSALRRITGELVRTMAEATSCL